MKTRSQILSNIWLQPIIQLIEKQDYSEAYSLAEYYPSTPGRKIMQTCSLVGDGALNEITKKLDFDKSKLGNIDDCKVLDAIDLFNQLDISTPVKSKTNDFNPYSQQSTLIDNRVNLLNEVNAILETSIHEARVIAYDFAAIFSKTKINLLNTANSLIDNYPRSNYLYIAYLLIETHLIENYKDVDNINKSFLQLATKTINDNKKIEFARICFERILEIKNNPQNLLDIADVIFAKPDSKISDNIIDYGKSKVEEAINTVNDNIEILLNGAKCLAYNEKTFAASCDLFRRALQIDYSRNHEVCAFLLPFITSKPYFIKIVDFLWNLNPQNVEILVKQLIYIYESSQNHSCIEKVLCLLKGFDYITKGYANEFANSIIMCGRHLSNFESYAKDLLKTNLSSKTLINIVNALFDIKSNNYMNIINEYLNKVCLRDIDASNKIEAIKCFIQLGKLADDNGNTDLCIMSLKKAVELITEYSELQQCIFHKDCFEYLNLFRKYKYIITNARWFNELKDKNIIKFLLKTNSADMETGLAKIEIMLNISNDELNIFSDDRYIPKIIDDIEEPVYSENKEACVSIRKIVRDFVEFFQDMTISEVKYFLNLVLNESIELSRDECIYITYKFVEDGIEEQVQDLCDRYIPNWLFSSGVATSDICKSSGNFEMPASECVEVSESNKNYNVREIERYTKIEFPEYCSLEKKVDLKIQITKDAPELTRKLEKLRFTVEKTLKEIELYVIVTAPGFAMHEKSKPMKMSIDNDSEIVVFHMFPMERGKKVIEIEIFYRAKRIGYVLVPTLVSRFNSAHDEAAESVLLEEPDISAAFESHKMEMYERRTLQVNWLKNERKLCYTVFSDDQGKPFELVQDAPELQEQIVDYLQELNANLTEIVTLGSPDDDEWQGVCITLQGAGKQLFNSLIPSDLIEITKNWTKGSTISISTNEDWIPWELMFDNNDFWGSKFIISRYPRMKDGREMPKNNRYVKMGERTVNRIVNIVGGDLPNTEADRARTLFKVEPIKEQSIGAIFKEFENADLVHFTCHGHLEPACLQVSKNKMRTQNLLITTVQELPIDPGCLIFANACSSNAPLISFGKFTTFGLEFYLKGAGIYIGTLGAVPIKYAIEFAESVYKELFNENDNITIGEAMAKAKANAANKRNLFWLLYTIYGDPDMTFKIQNN